MNIVGPSRRGALLLAAAAVAGLLRHAHADSASAALRGTAVVYQGISSDQIEELTPPAAIAAAVAQASDSSHVGAPSRIWQALEHGEKVDCLDCIPAVEGLLYSDNAKNREIAAWWLRRRIFGVFGSGQVYERVTQTLASHNDPVVRARAAEALGEFLTGAGTSPLTTALTHDADPRVRVAAARALDRLNMPGVSGDLATAMSDSDSTVRLAALSTATHLHAFTDIGAITRLLGDTDPLVRRHAASALGARRAKDGVSGLITLLTQDSDPIARAEAAHALGLIGDASARDALRTAAHDTDGFVRDAALMAERRL
jgi:HEAT repeat protein